ncbi:alpha/beta hydrolase [Rhodobacteraceae bacterium RKSG542]|uniref:alpha/beta hydrolase n=1 Tax=Pseudovibrio flavus TaxID=2529854 RepID=UPI0012BD2F05|nr:alpha/beta hydrolase [Pseudovibrio flavus]MTI17449.1 alpha/beta hydrolase [Pseudovibrio flavus]
MQTALRIKDWDKAYSNQGSVANAESIFSRWPSAATAFREDTNSELDITYGDSDKQKLDLFFPDRAPKGLVLIVHGGYWKAFDRKDFSHLAKGAVDAGYAVAMPSYDLCPNVSIADITKQIAKSLEVAASKVAGPIYLTGHSAGGHLVARLMCDDDLLSAAVSGRITRCVPISALVDLRPLLRTEMNDTLRLTEKEAELESPIFSKPRDGAEIVCWVGADELSEFRRQNKTLYTVWAGFDCAISYHEANGKNHFTVIEDLEDNQSALIRSLLHC